MANNVFNRILETLSWCGRNSFRILCASFCVGVALRIASVAYQGLPPHYQYHVGMDEVNYIELARSILDEHEYGCWSEGFFTRSTRAPIYPFLIAGIGRVTGLLGWAMPILNVTLDVVNIILIVLIGSLLYDRAIGNFAGALYSFFGPAFSYVYMGTPEITAVFLVLCVALSLLLLKRSYIGACVLLVMFYGILIHARPVFLLVTPFLAVSIWLFLERTNWKTRVVRTLIPISLIVLILVPWGVRNYIIHKSWVPVCTVAGWHLVTTAQNQDALSVDDVVAYVYKPEHEEFQEGDFYREGMVVFGREIIHQPVNILWNGVKRILGNWFIPAHPFRVLTPAAYVRPIPLSKTFHIYLPDSEGLTYLFLLVCCVCVIVIPFGRVKRSLFAWNARSLPILIILIGYVGVHVLGIPLTQYRFTIEPVVLVLMVGFVFFLLTEKQQKSEVRGQCVKLSFYLLSISLTTVLTLIFLPWMMKSILTLSPRIPSSKTNNDYTDVRTIQWKTGGDVPVDHKVCFQGVPRYMKSGLRFVENSDAAVEDSEFVVSKFYVGETLDHRGVGDVKLNIPIELSSRFASGASYRVTGTVKTGKYKDIIVDVESISPVATPLNAPCQNE